MAKTSKATTRTPNAAFMKPVTPDVILAKVIGDKPLPRTELTKKLWVYIRKNGLQDAKKRTLINADDNLKAVFNGKKQVSMFEMTKLVSGHLPAISKNSGARGRKAFCRGSRFTSGFPNPAGR
jgi:chromatin remodeling complex protein RSC6